MNNFIHSTENNNTGGLLAQHVIKLHDEGYNYDFVLSKNHGLLCLQNETMFTADDIKVSLVDLFYDWITHVCKYIHTIDTTCGVKGLLVEDKIYLPDVATVKKVMSKYKELNSTVSPVDQELPPDINKRNGRSEERLLVRFRDKILPFAYSEIALIFLENEITQIVTFDGQIYHIQRSLEDLEKQAGLPFYRVNRQYLINKTAIKDLSTSFTRAITINLVLNFPNKISVSKLKIPDFLDWLTICV